MTLFMNEDFISVIVLGVHLRLPSTLPNLNAEQFNGD